jgi:hypothetical protein
MLFKILHGDASRISTNITPYHEGYCYVTHSGDFYVDMNDERVKLNAKDAETIMGASLANILVNTDSEIPTSSAVLSAIEAATEVYVGPTKPTDPNIKVWINTAEDGTGVVPVLPRITTITLPQSSWTGNSSPYYQTVSINTVTPATKVELNPTVAQITAMQNDDIALMAENDNGTVNVYSFGGKPSSTMAIQCTLVEVSYV